MRIQPSVAILPFIALTLSSCQPASEQTEADVAAIQALTEEWSAAFNAGDVARIVALYTDDAIRMPPGAPTYTGIEAIEQVWSGIFEQYSGNLAWPTEEIVVAGNWGFHRGTYTATLTPLAAGEVEKQDGKVLVICRKQADGSWKLAREIWNYN